MIDDKWSFLDDEVTRPFCSKFLWAFIAKINVCNNYYVYLYEEYAILIDWKLMLYVFLKEPDIWRIIFVSIDLL